MERHNNMCLFMSMLYNKIKFEIDINNDELLKTIWEHMREIKRGGREDINKLTKPSFLLSLYFISFSHFQMKFQLKISRFI